MTLKPILAKLGVKKNVCIKCGNRASELDERGFCSECWDEWAKSPKRVEDTLVSADLSPDLLATIRNKLSE